MWPGREQGDRSLQEYDFATPVDLGHLYQNVGLAVAGSVPGLFHSSARAELVAAIVALLNQSTISLKADNHAVVCKAMMRMQSGSSGRKPWSLHKDGDLWEALFNIATSRGFSSFTMAWTKGHVTLGFLLNGSGQARDAVYNSLADRAAPVAVIPRAARLFRAQAAALYRDCAGHLQAHRASGPGCYREA